MFDFLGLPREIRDEIYKLCLVRGQIEFEEFYIDETPEDWMRDRKPEKLMLHVAKPDETPLLVYQGIPFVHRVESLTRIHGRCRWDDILYEDRERSYRIHRGTTDPPCLDIFLANRLIYQESSMVFYAKNSFCFPSRECELTLNACSGFLTDRPEQALIYISDISLEIGFIDRHHTDFTGFSGSLFYRIHWPTMQRLDSILKGTLDPKGLSKLKFLVQEQCPSKRALETHLKCKDYVDFFQSIAIFTRRNSLKNLIELQIDLVERSSWMKLDHEVKWMANFVLGRWVGNEFNVSSSIFNVGSKEMRRITLTWSSSKTK